MAGRQGAPRLPHPPRTVLVAASAAIFLGLVLFSLYLLRLDRELSERWTARLWDLPSRVYAAPTHLYAGLDVRSVDLLGTLETLGYRRVADGRSPGPGEYRVADGIIVLHLRDFDYPEGRYHGHPLELRLEGSRIVSMRHPDSDRQLHTARLEPPEVSAIFDAHMERRTPVRLEEVPASLVEAILAVEDRRFHRHRGVDPLRILRASLVNLRARRYVQGGSTLTQQLIKNYYLHHEKTLARKTKEGLMALVFEARRSKEEILEAYLNEVYLGQDGAVSIAGVEEAARFYFSKGVAQLDLAESALLAGMIRAPGLYDPSSRPDRARARRTTVLSLMAAQGRVAPEEAEVASETPLPGPRTRRTSDGSPYFTDFVLRELRHRFSRDALEREGYRIFTSLDLRAQRAAERAVSEGVAELERAYPRLTSAEPPLQASLVALNPGTGEILALVGGRDWASSQFNRAVQARRQPGSIFKPFVYLTSLMEGEWTLASRLSDSALSVQTTSGIWEPTNYDGAFHGTVSVREALEQSYNVATARLAMDVGLGRVAETARQVGIRSPLSPLPSMALGAFEVTPLEMATAYATLAAGGIRPVPRAILEVVTPDGEVLVADDLRMERVVPAAPTYLVNRALQGVLERGTAASAASLGYRGTAAGKTGTTNGYRDAWFVGYTPELLALAWTGFDDNRSLGLTGARAALPLWIRFMRDYETAGAAAGFAAPDGVVEVEVDVATGKRADERCGPWALEPFLEGTEPVESCREERRPWWRRIF